MTVEEKADQRKIFELFIEEGTVACGTNISVVLLSEDYAVFPPSRSHDHYLLSHWLVSPSSHPISAWGHSTSK